jgi:predicted O-methyltransferase YrrM
MNTNKDFNNVKDFCNEFDLIFIDGDHSYEGVKRDFEMYKRLLSPRGPI